MWGMAPKKRKRGAHLDGAGNALVLASEAARTRHRGDQECGRMEATGGKVQRQSGGGGMAMEQTAADGASLGSGVSSRGRQSLDCSGDGEELGGGREKELGGGGFQTRSCRDTGDAGGGGVAGGGGGAAGGGSASRRSSIDWGSDGEGGGRGGGGGRPVLSGGSGGHASAGALAGGAEAVPGAHLHVSQEPKVCCMCYRRTMSAFDAVSVMAESYSGLAWDCRWQVCSIGCAFEALEEYKRVATRNFIESEIWPVVSRPRTAQSDSGDARDAVGADSYGQASHRAAGLDQELDVDE